MLNAASSFPPDRQLCALYAREARDVYSGRSWREVEPLIRRAWESDPRNAVWAEVKPLMKSFWRCG